ncbi:MAG TPA: SDR family NAD(P)-dependent oxidoreductase, partial [Thermomicrobiales bacterium]|nr:SDR family NAD(P)-dependent oxidoreductase [Thermomicrobiales bacterium]
MTEPTAPNRQRFANQIVLITGGGSGIGRAMALAFAAEGAILVIADRHLDAAEGTVALLAETGANGIAVRTDVAVASDVQTMTETAMSHYGQ